MPSRESEALVLRSYPFRDADLIVSFFTRDRGKLRGVARGVRRPKNKFGSALERLAHARLFYRQKDNVELVTLERAELLGPANIWKASYASSVLLDAIAETADQLLPAGEPQDAYFRLLSLVLDEFRRGIAAGEAPQPAVPAWGHRALVYFLLWSLRLGGWLPPLDRCIESDRPFAASEPAYFSAQRDGLFLAEFKDSNSWPLSSEARALAQAMLRFRVDRMDLAAWRTPPAAALQQYLLQRIHMQLEGRLRVAAALDGLWRDEDAPPQAPIRSEPARSAADAG